jgi:phage tail-like protein
LKIQSAKIPGTVLGFTQFNPPSISLDNVNMNTFNGQGGTQANAGGSKGPLHGEWSLQRVVDKSGNLFQWLSDTNQQGPDAQKDNVTVTVLDQKGQTAATWILNGSVPTAYTMGGIDANSNAVLYESVSFYSTDVQLKLGGGGA